MSQKMFRTLSSTEKQLACNLKVEHHSAVELGSMTLSICTSLYGNSVIEQHKSIPHCGWLLCRAEGSYPSSSQGQSGKG